MADDYATFFFVTELREMLAKVQSLRATYRAAENYPAAEIVQAAWDKHLAGLTVLALDIAAIGTEMVREKERHTRVRPDSLGEGGPRLGDHLFVESLSHEGLPGSVGVVNETILDREVPWWSTNEQGSTGRLGGVVWGVFQTPGIAYPNPLEDRQHAVFKPDIAGGKMKIENPIPARRFIEQTIPEIMAIWKAQFLAMEADLIAEAAVAATV